MEQSNVKSRRIKLELAFMFLLITSALLLRVKNIDSYPVMSADGTGYALAGKRLIHSFNLRDVGGVMPPFYQFMIGLFDLLIDNLEMAARSVSVFFSTMTIVPLYLLARRYFGASVAAGAALLYVFLPFMHSMSGIDLSEPTYTFMMLTGLYLAVTGMTEKSKFTLFISGLFIGLAYLTRPEALVLFGGLWLVFVVKLMSKNDSAIAPRLILLICLTLGWLSVLAPYMNALHNITGKWQVSGKIGIGMQLVKERYGIQGAYESQFQLDRNGKLAADKGFDTPLSLLRERPGIFWSNIRDNLREFPGKVSDNFPYYLLILALIGCFRRPSAEMFAGRLPLYSTFIPLVSYIVFTFDPRYFYPYVPVLLIFVSAGADWISVHLADRFMPSRFLPNKYPVGIALIAVLSMYYIYLDMPRHAVPYDFTQDDGRFDDKQVGLRLKKVLPSESRLLTRSGRVGFYAGMPIVIPPEADLPTSLDYARNNGVTHVVANVQLYAMRQAFAPLFQPLITPGSVTDIPGLEVVYIGQESGGQPYLVYRLK